MKVKSLLLGIIMLLGMASAWAQGGTTGPLTWNINNGTLIISGNGAMPDYGSGEAPWYDYRESIPIVVIENGVTTIGNRAFYECYALTSITFPNSVTTIGYRAFSGCSALTSITLPNSVTTIGDMAFYDCYALTSITLPNSVTTIGESAFSYCSALTSITLPNSVTTIGDMAFYYCRSLTSIEVESGNANYSSDNGVLFDKAKNLIICYPAGKTDTNYTLPNSVTTIGDYAFSYCSALTSITFPNSVTTIGDKAFTYCSKLTSITLPNSVTTIGDMAFYYCRSLTSIEVESGNANYSSDNGVLFDKAKTLIICYPAGKTDANYTIPNSVTTISDYAFSYCSALTSITLPNSVTTIGGSAFYYCSALTSITLSNSLTTIGNRAFYHCSSLTSITLPNSVTTIGKSTFSNCSSLTSITLPNSVTTIGERTFYYCSSLTSITLSNSLTTIGNAAFISCSSLTSITLPNNVTTIGDSAFLFCSALTSITLPNSVTTIGANAFSGCSSLTSITNLNPVPVDISYLYLFEGENINTITLTVPTSAVSAYQNAAIWQEMNIVGGGILVNPVSNNIEQGYTTGDALYQINETATVAAIAYSGWKFINWTKDGAVISTDNPYSFTVTEDVELVANFEEISIYSVKVNVNNSKYGEATGEGTYEENETATVIAIAYSGCKFINWTKDGAVISTDNLYSFTVTEDVELVANFEEISIYSVKVNVNNSKYGEATGEGTYEENETATVIAIAYSGCKFINWTKDGAVISTDNPYSFTVTEDVELVANFEGGAGIETIESDVMSVYPNPTHGELQIKNYELGIRQIQVFDVMGRMVMVAEPHGRAAQQDEITTTLDISHLPAGIYFLQIQTETGTVTKKVMKQ